MFRRLVRVFPAYYAQLVLLAFILWIQLRQIPITDGAILWRHLLMLFVPPPIGTTPINGVWWTLPIEFSFYLVLPLFAILLRPGRWWLLLGLGLISMWLWRYVSISLLAGQPTPSKMLMAYQLPGSMDSFGLGMLGSVIYVNRVRLGLDRLSSVALSATVLGAIVVIICALYWMHYRHMDYWEHSVLFYAWTPLFCLAVVVLLFAGVSGCRIVNALFANRFMVFLGVISYSVYLWHYPILEWLMRSTLLVGFDGYRLPLLLGTAFVLTLFAASLSYVLIERPFMQLRREKTSRVVPATVL